MTAMTGFILSLCLSAGPQPAPTPLPAPSPTPPTKAPIDLVWMVAPPSAEDAAPPPPNTAALRSKGVALFTQHCASCHGKRGDGRGQAAASLSVKPTDFTKAIFKVRSTQSGTLPKDVDLYVTLSRGMHGTEMFPWAKLSSTDRWALVQRIKAFSPRWKQEQPGRAFTFATPAPNETDALRAKGKSLYAQLRCGACHGVEGAANGPAAALYKDPSGQRPVYIRDFRKGQFLRGSQMQDIVMTLRTGLDGTPMGPYDALAEPDLWALASYVRGLVSQRPVPEPTPAVP
ncbi:MAG: cytochrome c [Deltaproteobacteria bacterium]|nr:cytochrome c [Deltaproteobacteria bacterium]